MALLTDDQDIRESYLRTMLGGNGDYYIEITEVQGGFKTVSCVRVATSGGNASPRIRLAVAELHRAMEEAELNEYPD